MYNAISCSCAQWSEAKYSDYPDKRKYFYLERASNKLLDADSLFQGENLPIRIRVRDKVVNEYGYAKGYDSIKGKGDPAIVFRYTELKVIKR